MNFDTYWKYLQDRCDRLSFPLVQDKEEMNYIYDTVQGCKSYLEIGTAEGNSIYIMSKALASDALIVSLDWQEPHTRNAREEVFNDISQRVVEIAHNSHSDEAIGMASKYRNYEVVMIDAGHDYEDVIADAICYGRLATKYIFFHDVALPDVYRAFSWYCKIMKIKNHSIYSSPDSPYGYGVIKL